MFLTCNTLSYRVLVCLHLQNGDTAVRRRYSAQLRVTVEPATAAALEAEADATQTSVSAVIRDAVTRGLPLVKDARRKRRSGPRSGGGAGEP